METDRKVYLILAPLGVFLFLILPRDPWSANMLTYLVICSIVSSIFSQLFIKNLLKAFVLSVGLVSLLLFIGVLVIDINLEGTEVLSEYMMWLPLMIGTIISYGLAGTLSLFGVVSFTINKIKKHKH